LGDRGPQCRRVAETAAPSIGATADAVAISDAPCTAIVVKRRIQ
jgi:hypothetical protein